MSSSRDPIFPKLRPLSDDELRGNSGSETSSFAESQSLLLGSPPPSAAPVAAAPAAQPLLARPVRPVVEFESEDSFSNWDEAEPLPPRSTETKAEPEDIPSEQEPKRTPKKAPAKREIKKEEPEDDSSPEVTLSPQEKRAGLAIFLVLAGFLTFALTSIFGLKVAKNVRRTATQPQDRNARTIARVASIIAYIQIPVAILLAVIIGFSLFSSFAAPSPEQQQQNLLTGVHQTVENIQQYVAVNPEASEQQIKENIEVEQPAGTDIQITGDATNYAVTGTINEGTPESGNFIYNSTDDTFTGTGQMENVPDDVGVQIIDTPSGSDAE